MDRAATLELVAHLLVTYGHAIRNAVNVPDGAPDYVIVCGVRPVVEEISGVSFPKVHGNVACARVPRERALAAIRRRLPSGPSGAAHPLLDGLSTLPPAGRFTIVEVQYSHTWAMYVPLSMLDAVDLVTPPAGPVTTLLEFEHAPTPTPTRAS